MLRMTAFCFNVEVFISRIGMKISWRRTSISFCSKCEYSLAVVQVDFANLELGAKAGDDPPEDLDANLEDLGYRTDRIPTQRQA